MDVDILAGFRTAAEFTLESSFIEHYSHRAAGQKIFLVYAVELGDISPHRILWRASVAIQPLIATGDYSLQVGGKDSVRWPIEPTGLGL
jgi:hypothetical protein